MATRILVIDDEDIYSKTIAIHLATKGYDVVTEDGGLAGLAYAVSNPNIDLILLDLMMPDMYGLEVLRNLKEHPLLHPIPVILQTGIANEDEINEGIEGGAIACIRKPFNRKDLLEAVEEAIHNAGFLPPANVEQAATACLSTSS